MSKSSINNTFSLKNEVAYAQINKSYNQLVPKTNTKPAIIEKEQVGKKIKCKIW